MVEILDERGGVTNPISAAIKELKDTSPPITPWMTYLLIFINIIVFLATIQAVYNSPWRIGISPIAFINNPLDSRVLVSMFAHAGFFHLLGNMVVLYIVGDNVEAVMGRFKYLIFYLLTGYFAVVGQSVFTAAVKNDPYDLAMPMLGASGAIAGVMAAYLYSYPGAEKMQCPCIFYVCYCFRLKVKYLLLLWILYQFILLGFESHIAVFAHIGGLLAGFALSPFFISKKRVSRIKQLFMSGEYSGLKPSREELISRSFDAVCYLIVILVTVSVLAVSIIGIANYSSKIVSTSKLYLIDVRVKLYFFDINYYYFPGGYYDSEYSSHTVLHTVTVAVDNRIVKLPEPDSVGVKTYPGSLVEQKAITAAEKAVEKLLENPERRISGYRLNIGSDGGEYYVAIARIVASYEYPPLGSRVLLLSTMLIILSILAFISLKYQEEYEVL